jgi:hypothetical protein
MSFTDQPSVTPGSVNCESDKPAYDSLNAVHAWSTFLEAVVYPWPFLSTIHLMIRNISQFIGRCTPILAFKFDLYCLVKKPGAS